MPRWLQLRAIQKLWVCLTRPPCTRFTHIHTLCLFSVLLHVPQAGQLLCDAFRYNKAALIRALVYGRRTAIRFTYCALLCLSILDRTSMIDVAGALGFIARCKNFDGGFGCTPGELSLLQDKGLGWRELSQESVGAREHYATMTCPVPKALSDFALC